MDSRKEAILEAIVQEHVATGQPVGSVGLVAKYHFPYSTATVRAEMAELERLGFLLQPHTSAGRVPSEKGYRYYVKMMDAERQLLGRESVVAQKRLAAMRGSYERQLETASCVISDLTRNMGFAGLPGEVFSQGLSYLFSQPEFLDSRRVLRAAELIDNLGRLFDEVPTGTGPRIFIGSESPISKSSGCSIIISELQTPFGRGYLGVLGPMRMAYEKNLSIIKEVKEILEEQNG
jgi:heat-inducible transcriptional repressor